MIYIHIFVPTVNLFICWNVLSTDMVSELHL